LIDLILIHIHKNFQFLMASLVPKIFQSIWKTILYLEVIKHSKVRMLEALELSKCLFNYSQKVSRYLERLWGTNDVI